MIVLHANYNIATRNKKEEQKVTIKRKKNEKLKKIKTSENDALKMLMNIFKDFKKESNGQKEVNLTF